MEDDRRNYERVILDKKAVLSGADGEWETRLVDISLKGVLLDKPEDWSGEVGDVYALTIPLGKAGEPSIDMNVEVAHQEADQVGFTWQEIDGESFDHLERLLTYNLNDRKQVQRELKTLFEQH